MNWVLMSSALLLTIVVIDSQLSQICDPTAGLQPGLWNGSTIVTGHLINNRTCSS